MNLDFGMSHFKSVDQHNKMSAEVLIKRNFFSKNNKKAQKMGSTMKKSTNFVKNYFERKKWF